MIDLIILFIIIMSIIILFLQKRLLDKKKLQNNEHEKIKAYGKLINKNKKYTSRIL